MEIVVLPVGKSLDKCAELREAKKLRKPVGQEAGRRRRRRRGKGKGTGSLEPIHQQQVRGRSGVSAFSLVHRLSTGEGGKPGYKAREPLP